MPVIYNVSHESRATRYARNSPFEVETTGPDMTLFMTVSEEVILVEGVLAEGFRVETIPAVPSWLRETHTEAGE